MCGIVGYFSPENSFSCTEALSQATSLISHRGPDDEGYALFNLSTNKSLTLVGPDSPDVLKRAFPPVSPKQAYSHHLAFGFRRFSIVDLSEKGHQPFWNQDKSICLVFNGEIYNYVEIKEELQKLGHSFATSCDTEVLLTGYQQWGMDVLKKCNGPIALVLCDCQKRKLYFARDRLGKSPLYYAVNQNTLYWASEIKSILSMTGSSAFQINEQAVYDYLTYGWKDIDNQTFWKGIFTFPAASWAEINLDTRCSYQAITRQTKRYWEIPASRLTAKQISFQYAKEQFEELLKDSVLIRARADAKVAYSLSGGLDSSSIVAVAAELVKGPKPISTYSICFPGEAQDEEPLARLVAQRYQNKIHYQTYTPQNDDFWAIADRYVWLMEEPFHFPNAELFQAYFRKARAQGYKVMITGAGGDELLAGYGHYFIPLLRYQQGRGQYTEMVQNLLMKRDIWPKYLLKRRLKMMWSLLKGDFSLPELKTPFAFFNASGHNLAHHYFRDHNLVSKTCERQVPTRFEEMMTGYMSNWLMNYWLRNSNKSHFGVPMESRSPFLDYRLIDFSFQLPPEYLIQKGWSKYILRKVMAKRLPSSVIWNRTKRGLPFNTKKWFEYSQRIASVHLQDAIDNPYVNVLKVQSDYDELTTRDPALLWRLLNFCLWWKRLVMQKRL